MRDAQPVIAELFSGVAVAVCQLFCSSCRCGLPRDFRPKVLALPVRLSLDDPGPLKQALDRLFA